MPVLTSKLPQSFHDLWPCPGIGARWVAARDQFAGSRLCEHHLAAIRAQGGVEHVGRSLQPQALEVAAGRRPFGIYPAAGADVAVRTPYIRGLVDFAHRRDFAAERAA